LDRTEALAILDGYTPALLNGLAALALLEDDDSGPCRTKLRRIIAAIESLA
jgi:hypothetical protein